MTTERYKVITKSVHRETQSYNYVKWAGKKILNAFVYEI